MHLYQMTAEYEAIIKAIEDAEGEVTPELMAQLDALGGAFTEKADNIAAVVRTVEATAAAVKGEQDRLAGYRKSLDTHADWLKHYLQEQMIRTGNEKVEGARFRISIRACPASVDVQDEVAVPDSFKVEQAPRLDRKGILDLLKAGGEVPGCALVTDRKTLSIR